MGFSITAGLPFSVRVIQSANEGATKWANTLEYVASSDLDENGASALAAQVGEAFRSVLINRYKVEKIVVSTWVPDGQPYNPDSFISFAYNLQGLRGRFGDDPVDLSICLRIDKRASSGRSGRMLLRGVLHEGMLKTVGGRYNFENPAPLDSVDWGDGINRLFSLVNVPQGRMHLVSNMYQRAVLQLSVAGITIKKLNNKYFDRS